ncbi:MAG: hypothetical protein AAF518_23215 [Spirochaetota bacterium]
MSKLFSIILLLFTVSCSNISIESGDALELALLRFVNVSDSSATTDTASATSTNTETDTSSTTNTATETDTSSATSTETATATASSTNTSTDVSIDYNSSGYYTYTLGVTATELVPTITGIGTTCSISSELPSGFSFNTSTCLISATPTIPTEGAALYIVTITDSAGASANASLFIGVAVETSCGNDSPCEGSSEGGEE